MNAQQARPKKRRTVLWVFVLLLVVGMIWTLSSENPFAQGVREALGSKPNQLVLNKSFSLPPHGFRYYTFTLPNHSKNVAIVGSFDTAVGKSTATDHPGEAQQPAPQSDDGIQVYLLAESDVLDWQKGTANSFQEISRGPKGTLRKDLPDGPGLFYVVFSNRRDSSPRTVKAVAFLQYKSWLPHWEIRPKSPNAEP